MIEGAVTVPLCALITGVDLFRLMSETNCGNRDKLLFFCNCPLKTLLQDTGFICSLSHCLNCRKHALNCHRMKPALFTVLCEIKEKTGIVWAWVGGCVVFLCVLKTGLCL